MSHNLSREERERIVNLLVPYVRDATAQQVLIESALADAPTFKATISVGSPAWDFANLLVRDCLEYGELETGELALNAILDQIYSRVGKEKKRQIEELQQAVLLVMQGREQQRPKSTPAIILPEPTTQGNNNHIIILYASEYASAFIDDLRMRLGQERYQTLLDTEVKSGKNGETELSNAISTAAVVLVVITSSNVHEHWLQAEVQLAEKLSKPIIPIIASHFVAPLSGDGQEEPNQDALALRLLGLENYPYRHFRKLGDTIGFERIVNDLRNAKVVKMRESPPVTPKLSSPRPVDEVVKGKPYVFISYARPDARFAEIVQDYLTQSGIQVFRDTKDIHSGQSWDIQIENALQSTTHMVLILSSHSMPYRKEVHREWFYFDQKNKPIHGLYVETCDLHSRLYSYNYLDIAAFDTGIHGACEILLEDLLKEESNALKHSETKSLESQIGDAESDDRIIVAKGSPFLPLEEALANLYDMIRQKTISSEDDSKRYIRPSDLSRVVEYNPTSLKHFRVVCYAEWSQDRYHLDNRFVNLSLVADKQDNLVQYDSYAKDKFRHNLLRVLEDFPDESVIVLLGSAGSGKSTLLRRLQMDLCQEQIRAETETENIVVYVQLSEFDENLSPAQWLDNFWERRFSNLGKFSDFAAKGSLLLLADGLDELRHSKSDAIYNKLLVDWMNFAWQLSQQSNRIIFSCRTTAYLPQASSIFTPLIVRVQPMAEETIRDFLAVYLPKQLASNLVNIAQSPHYDFYRIPIFLRLLIKLVEGESQVLPSGKARLFTHLIQETLNAEINRQNVLFTSSQIVTQADRQWLENHRFDKTNSHAQEGLLFAGLTNLALYSHQLYLEGKLTEMGLPYLETLQHTKVDLPQDVIEAAVTLRILIHDKRNNHVRFWHRMFREYFVARAFAQEPTFELLQAPWERDDFEPRFVDLLTANKNEYIPSLPSTGWENVVIFAAEMVASADEFITKLSHHNLILAARCVIDESIKVNEITRSRLRDKLRDRLKPKTDLRVRIQVAEVLMEMGHPEFVLKQGEHGTYLWPPMKPCPLSSYKLGQMHVNANAQDAVPLRPYSIAVYPVTVAEYRCFVASGGYQQEMWWKTTEDQLQWWRGVGEVQGVVEQYRKNRKLFQEKPFLLKQLRLSDRANERIVEMYQYLIKLKDADFEAWLKDNFGQRRLIERPSIFYDVAPYNHPSHPIVGVNWYEALAYCNWLSKQDKTTYTLPTEIEWEAAARGSSYTDYPHGTNQTSIAQYNTAELRLGKPTPIGVFVEGKTQNGIHDLCGNVFEWTSSLTQESGLVAGSRDGLEERGNRVIRGGSWLTSRAQARTTSRNYAHPEAQSKTIGFRLVRYVD